MDSVIEFDNGKVYVSLFVSVWTNVNVFEIDLKLFLPVCFRRVKKVRVTISECTRSSSRLWNRSESSQRRP